MIVHLEGRSFGKTHGTMQTILPILQSGKKLQFVATGRYMNDICRRLHDVGCPCIYRQVGPSNISDNERTPHLYEIIPRNMDLHLVFIDAPKAKYEYGNILQHKVTGNLSEFKSIDRRIVDGEEVLNTSAWGVVTPYLVSHENSENLNDGDEVIISGCVLSHIDKDYKSPYGKSVKVYFNLSADMNLIHQLVPGPGSIFEKLERVNREHIVLKHP